MKNFYYGLLVGVIAVGGVWYLSAFSGDAGLATIKKAVLPAATPLYSNILKQFAGRRVQFGQNCEGIPGKLSVKAGSTILLDNRSSQARTVKIGNNAYNLPGYGYGTVNLNNLGDWGVSCDGRVNTSMILVH